MKRLVCLILIALMLFASIACNFPQETASGNESASNNESSSGKSGNKNQVVHIGETVQYGDLEIKFNLQGVDYLCAIASEQGWAKCVPYSYACINLILSYNGNGEIKVPRTDFSAYVEGMQVSSENDVSSERKTLKLFERLGFHEEDKEKKAATITMGRSSDLWIVYRVPLGTETVEFDYVNSRYADEYGRVTFVVDIPREYPDEDEALLGKWSSYWGEFLLTLSFDGNRKGNCSLYYYYSKELVDYGFEYTILADNTLLISFDKVIDIYDFSNYMNLVDIWHYSVWGDELVLDATTGLTPARGLPDIYNRG